MTSATSLEWNNLGLTHKKTKKKILNNLNGRVNCGEFLTIMGQSGAGKSSFLSILTARITSRSAGFIVEGEVLMNGKQFNIAQFGKCAAYVRQDDIIMGTLTVEETFEFQAKLKLHELSETEQQYKINQIVKKLNLEECKKALVGSQFSKSISGGQRKRVAIGIELLADPSCLILDQPTSGLDSSNSLKIVQILKKLAADGRVVIATIHQPSTLMFHQMDKLMLMGKGSTLYFGNTEQIVPYMMSIGVKVDYRMNPADFFMLQISEFKNSKNYKTPMTPQNFMIYQAKRKNKDRKMIQNSQQNMYVKQAVPVFEPSTSQPSLIKQFPILFKRSFKNYFRTISNLYGKICMLIIIPVFMCVLYHNIANEFPQDIFDLEIMAEYLNKVGAFLFMFTFFNFGMNLYDTILAFPPEKQLVLKETSANLYSLINYYFCRCLIQLPISCSICIVSTTIVYFVAGLQPDFDFYFRFILVTTLVAICGYMLGSFIGIVFSTSEHAIQILPIIVIPLILFGGLIVNLSTIPAYARWAQYISPIRHTYSALMIDQLSSPKMHNIMQFEDIVRQFVGINGTYLENTLTMVGLAIGCSLASLITFYIKKKPI